MSFTEETRHSSVTLLILPGTGYDIFLGKKQERLFENLDEELIYLAIFEISRGINV
jgi:hypothetical protein